MLTNLQTDDFHVALAAERRASEVPEESDAYGWFIGDWELDVLRYWANDVTARRIKGEVHARWVLEGRGIQDLWIMPSRSERAAKLDKKLNMYGTTIRIWDPTISAWRITWINPAGDHYEQQIGRKNGPDVVQLGVRPDGTPTRWSFVEITHNSFHWLGEALEPDGRTWMLEGEFHAKRM